MSILLKSDSLKRTYRYLYKGVDNKHNKVTINNRYIHLMYPYGRKFIILQDILEKNSNVFIFDDTDKSLTIDNDHKLYFIGGYYESIKSQILNIIENDTPATTPSAPTINSITAGNTQLSVAFTAGATGGSAITNYQYSTNNGSTFTNAGTTSSPITITGLTMEQHIRSLLEQLML